MDALWIGLKLYRQWDCNMESFDFIDGHGYVRKWIWDRRIGCIGADIEKRWRNLVGTLGKTQNPWLFSLQETFIFSVLFFCRMQTRISWTISYAQYDSSSWRAWKKQGKLPHGYIHRAALFASDRIPTGAWVGASWRFPQTVCGCTRVYAGKIWVGRTSYATAGTFSKNDVSKGKPYHDLRPRVVPNYMGKINASGLQQTWYNCL